MHFYIVIDLFIHSVVLSHSPLAVCGLHTAHLHRERESLFSDVEVSINVVQPVCGFPCAVFDLSDN